MKWIYLSPHIDDAVYSCGGLIWEQTQAGDSVEIWTVCAGDPPPGPLSPFAQKLHHRWGTGAAAGQVRRAEDLRAGACVGANVRQFDLPDCIYRRDPVSREAWYASEAAIFGKVHPEDTGTKWLVHQLKVHLPSEALVVCPLTLGNHVDHQLVRAAAEKAGCVQWYYADFPYAAREETDAERRVPAGWRRELFPISPAGLQAWADGAALYASQISTFWADETAIFADFQAYTQQHGGIRLWGNKETRPN
ncbi:MAG: PIG-L family deacetylase [Anaerolineales bacterium]|nr:PIG-L family deacetylase [Anaerolineales bacterium]